MLPKALRRTHLALLVVLCVILVELAASTSLPPLSNHHITHTDTASAPESQPHQLPVGLATRQNAALSTFTYSVSGDSNGVFTEAIEFSFSVLDRVWSSDLPVNTRIEFQPIGSDGGVLAFASPTSFVPLQQGGELYAGATAEAATGENVNNPGALDLTIGINSRVAWYTGTDARPPSSQTDFVSVFIHEVIHGLGFVGLLSVERGEAFFELGAPSRFDRFLADGDGCSILTYRDMPDKLYQAVTNNFLYFADETGALVGRLHAPSTFAPGSSVFHLSNSLDGTDDDLQTPSLPPGFANHNIGNVTSIILSLIADPTHEGARVCANQRDPSDAPVETSDTGFFNQLVLGLPAWLFIVLVGAGTLVLLLGTFVISSVARITGRDEAAARNASRGQQDDSGPNEMGTV